MASSGDDRKPPPAAAAAASNDSKDSDEMLAKKWNAMEQLTQVFGFDAGAAKQAIEVVGPDVEACCTFILDAGLGIDQGGPVVPIDNCPHLNDHFKLDPSQLEDSFIPTHTVCSYSDDNQLIVEVSNQGEGLPKEDVNHDTGTCPSKENWLCLECGALRCSRYVNGHGLSHWEKTKKSDSHTATSHENPPVGHCVGLSLSDLSVWCYVCGAYLHHPALKPILDRLEELKFKDSNSQEETSRKAYAKEG